jgi:hypothetical protein
MASISHTGEWRKGLRLKRSPLPRKGRKYDESSQSQWGQMEPCPVWKRWLTDGGIRGTTRSSLRNMKETLQKVFMFKSL